MTGWRYSFINSCILVSMMLAACFKSNLKKKRNWNLVPVDGNGKDMMLTIEQEMELGTQEMVWQWFRQYRWQPHVGQSLSLYLLFIFISILYCLYLLFLDIFVLVVQSSQLSLMTIFILVFDFKLATSCFPWSDFSPKPVLDYIFANHLSFRNHG